MCFLAVPEAHRPHDTRDHDAISGQHDDERHERQQGEVDPVPDQSSTVDDPVPRPIQYQGEVDPVPDVDEEPVVSRPHVADTG